ncbi:Metacaspase-1 [Wickerhamiella sorbophila]|uniref:Metacaspase-1 n=1 Tax=Wickerhamiella sorbophila TaxID=45607 RepID=A0A2T0FM10_9ASCO|nr:Metacaspase-1 [Wickerhamiella sorbophila]PRT56019.1 Metacaspase-1 [Wickerhamiella sorbophila]
MSGPMPPSGMQMQNGVQWQYSNNSGRRKALLIGINYYGSRNQLNGCVNDAHAMASFLSNDHGYRQEDMVVLTDDQRNPRSVPTRQNMLDAMRWLVSGAQPNDCLVFHYSGHGGTTPDLDGDEDDGYDEVIYPVDFEVAGQIVDDEMHEIMVRPLPPGCRLTAFFDSCHSGTALDLPYVYSTKGVVKEPNMLAESGKGVLNAFMSYESGDMSGAFNSVKGLFNRAKFSGNRDRVIQEKFSPADVISFSGCRDDQTSADASEGGVSAGAMSYSFLEVMGRDPNQSYISLLNNVRAIMQGKFQQKPQLSCSHPLDMNLQFIL